MNRMYVCLKCGEERRRSDTDADTYPFHKKIRVEKYQVNGILYEEDRNVACGAWQVFDRKLTKSTKAVKMGESI